MQELPDSLASPLPAQQLPIVYHSAYNIKFFGIEKLHPFDSTKFQKVKEGLVKQGLLRSDQVSFSNVA